MFLNRFFIIITVIFCHFVSAQDSLCFNKKYIAKNNVTAELGGVCVWYSLNYERNFLIKEKSFHTLRSGISYMDFPFYVLGRGFYFPLAYSYTIGKRKSKFFTGMNATLLLEAHPWPNSYASVQYVRHHPHGIYNQGSPYSDIYRPLISAVLSPFIGYEVISKKHFFFKVYATVTFYEWFAGRYYVFPSDDNYYFPLPGFALGFKLKK